jgi:hypothetical protein
MTILLFCISLPTPSLGLSTNLTRTSHLTSHDRPRQSPQSSRARPSPSTRSAAPTTVAQPAPTAASVTAAASSASAAAAQHTAATDARQTTAPAGSPPPTPGLIWGATRMIRTRVHSTPPSSSRGIRWPSARLRVLTRGLPLRGLSSDRSVSAGRGFLMAGRLLPPRERVTRHAQVTPRQSAADPIR